jgi:hypothetical protein
MSVKRQRPRDDSELAQRINTYVNDPVAQRFDRQHTEPGIVKAERRKTEFWRRRAR